MRASPVQQRNVKSVLSQRDAADKSTFWWVRGQFFKLTKYLKKQLQNVCVWSKSVSILNSACM